MVDDTVSITLDRELLKKIDQVIESGVSPFSSRSALIEYYLKTADLDEFLISDISVDVSKGKKP